MSITSALYERVSRNRVSRLLPRSGFGRHVAVVAGGTVLAQVLTVLAAPLLTRLYTPQDFGVLAAFAALYGPLSVMVSWRYEHAIPLPQDDPTATNLLALAAVVALGMVSLVGAAVWIGAEQIATALQVAKLQHYLWLLPLALLIGALLGGLTQWTIRKKAFGFIARTRISRSVTQSGTQCLLGLLQIKPLGLLLGETLGQTGGAGTLAYSFRRKGRPKLACVSLEGMRRAARRYLRFPLIATPSAILNILATSLPLVFLTMCFGQAQAGIFLLAQRLAGSPVTFVSNSVSQVFYSDLASHKDDYRRSLRRFRKLSGVLAILGLVGSTVLLTAPCWAGALLGQKWEEAGWIMAAIVPMLVGRLVASSLAHAYYVYSKQHLLFVLDSARLGLIVATFTVSAIAGFSFPLTVFLFSSAMAILYVAYWLVILLFLRAGVGVE